MMKVSVYIATSLDGFIAREDGDIAWLHALEDQEGEDYGYQDFMASVDCLVMGRKTFEKVLSFETWPYQKPVVVMSRQGLQLPPERQGDVRIRSSTPADLLSELAKEGVEHVYLDGGQMIQSFLRLGLIDALILSRIPRLIGKGIPLFAELAHDIRLNHRYTKSYPSGLVQSSYHILRD